MYHFVGFIFSSIITVRLGGGTFSSRFYFRVSFKTWSHRNENFLIGQSYYYETELNIEAKKKLKKTFPQNFHLSPTFYLSSSLSLSHYRYSLLIKRFQPAYYYISNRISWSRLEPAQILESKTAKEVIITKKKKTNDFHFAFFHNVAYSLSSFFSAWICAN